MLTSSLSTLAGDMVFCLLNAKYNIQLVVHEETLFIASTAHLIISAFYSRDLKVSLIHLFSSFVSNSCDLCAPVILLQYIMIIF